MTIQSGDPMNDRKLILDVDTGIDDALALAYLATFDNVNLLGVVGTYGNVAMGTAVRNTEYVLERLGLRHVPVLRGSSHPSWATSFIPDAGCAQFHGTDGLGGFGPAAFARTASAPAGMPDSGETGIPATSAPTYVSDSAESDMRSLISVGGYDVHDPHANPATDSFSLTFSSCDSANVPCSPTLPEGVRFIIDAVRRYGGGVTVVATGPLTDVDTALTAAPDIAGKLKLVMMGGTLTQEGNCWDLTAETNIIQDPEAANRVFHSGADTTMIGLDVTHRCLLGGMATRRWRETADLREHAGLDPSAYSYRLFSPRTLRFLADIADFSIAANLKSDARLFSAGMPLHDPLAAAVALDSTLVSCLDLPMKVETETGDSHGTRGRTIGDPEGLIDPQAPRIHVALHVEAERFMDAFSTRIAGIRR
ncbi:nucleoside hydrolase [Bifidobacterium moukalabense]|nr:nucleoside hydrolase [Bifidobacterium moukalabense]